MTFSIEHFYLNFLIMFLLKSNYRFGSLIIDLEPLIINLDLLKKKLKKSVIVKLI